MAPAPAGERHQIIISADLIRRIDNWRRRQEDLPNKSEAIRLLVEAALDSDEAHNSRPKPRGGI